VEIVVKGRNVEVPDHFRQHVIEKLGKAIKLDRKIMTVDVELQHEPNRRQHDRCQRVELTVVSRGPVVRAEACARDFYTALDEAIDRLTTRLRRAADRRTRSRKHRLPTAAVVGALNGGPPRSPTAQAEPSPLPEVREEPPWHIVREKEHPDDPITVEDALFRMELVGHDFYLFRDKETGRPSVVYRRKAYDYGVISLAAAEALSG
jgi:ribosomal subunit interface protein